MSDQDPPPPKTKLKINIVNRRASIVMTPSAVPPSTASAATPGAPPSSARTLIKIKAVKDASPAHQSPAAAPVPPPLVSAKTKSGRQTKPTKKLVEAIKRDFGDLDDDDDDEGSDQPVKKIKLRQNKPGTTVRLKHKGRMVVRSLGEGYDSEASDREVDPVVDQQFIIRMPPGEHCDYVRQSIASNRFDPKAPERKIADISLRFFEESSRRAVMTVKGQAFAAVLLDLPTITETMKTWDRKTFLKSADICQMLLVFAPVDSEEEARTVPLPPAVEQGSRWPHGLTPPMHDCVKRRFAKTISRKEIEDKEAEVERLLEEDRKALSTEWRWYDPIQAEKPSAGVDSAFEEDADGEPDEAVAGADNDDDDLDLQNELENELQNAFEEEMAAIPTATQPAADARSATMAVDTPATAAAAQQESDVSEEDADDDDDEDDDEEDDDDDEEEESDEEVSEEQQRLRETREIIADLRRQRATKQAERDRANMPMMKNRCENIIRSITQEIRNKLRSIGIEDEEDFDG